MIAVSSYIYFCERLRQTEAMSVSTHWWEGETEAMQLEVRVTIDDTKICLWCD